MIYLPDGSIYDGPAIPDGGPSEYEQKFGRLFEETFMQRFAGFEPSRDDLSLPVVLDLEKEWF